MTPERLNEIEALANAATPCGYCRGLGRFDGYGKATAARGVPGGMVRNCIECKGTGSSDAPPLSVVRELIAEVRAKDAEIERLRASLNAAIEVLHE